MSTYIEYYLSQLLSSNLEVVKPPVCGVQADFVCASLGFDKCVQVEAFGFSGGI